MNVYETEKNSEGCDIPKRDNSGKLIKKIDLYGIAIKATDIAGKPIPPTCVVCGTVGHPANWRGCTQYQTIIDRRDKNKDKESKEQKPKKKQNKNITTTLGKMAFPSPRLLIKIFLII